MAIETRVICDFCERPLEVDTIYEDGHAVDNIQLHTTKEWNTKKLFPHLCKSCAGKLDMALAKLKNEAVLEKLVNERNIRLNKERREKLGTKG